MKIAIFGASSDAGRVLTRIAIERGMEVSALARNPAKLDELSCQINVFDGDYFDRAATARTIEGCNAVVSMIGAPMGRKHTVVPQDFENGLRGVLGGMDSAGITRFVNVSSVATRFAGEKVGLTRQFMRGVAHMLAPIMTPSKELELALLKRSDIRWTSIRVPRIVDTAKGTLMIDPDGFAGMRVTQEQLANLMLDCVTSDDWVNKAPFVATV